MPSTVVGQRVVASFEDGDQLNCVDIFVRADGTYGFEGFRRDLDSGAGWLSMASSSHRIFASGDEALRAAQAHFRWMDPRLTWKW